MCCDPAAARLLLVAVGVASLVLGTFAMLVAPWLPTLENEWLRAVQTDRYYHLLVPLTVPVTIVAVSSTVIARVFAARCSFPMRHRLRSSLPAGLHQLVLHEAV